MANPLCATDCDQPLAAVEFDDCAPEINLSEIKRMFVAKGNAAAFLNWAQAAEWTDRLSQSGVEVDAIRELTVIGDMPAGSGISKDISNGRKYIVGKDRTINFTIDDVSNQNYEFARSTECGGKYRVWIETMGGKMYGGNRGIKASVVMDILLNRGDGEIESIAGVASWRAKFSPERVDSPIFVSDND